MRNFFLWLVVVWLWVPGSSGAYAGAAPFSSLLMGSLNYQYISTEADTVAGATYTRSYSQPASLKIELGFVPVRSVYMGFVLDHWMAGRTYNTGTEIADTLQYQVLALELGYITGNPRSFFIVSAMVGYPLKLSIASTDGQTYLPNVRAPLAFGGRAIVGLRFASWFALMLEGGYRVRNLGVFASELAPYLASGAALNFSGVYISTGVGLTL
jgi:hypothetical protein